MGRQLVKGVISDVQLCLIEITDVGDRYRRLVPAEIRLSGKGWLDDETEVDLNFIRLSPQREKELRNILDSIMADLIG